MAHPWLTSDELIEAIKKKIAMPIAQNLFTEQDILDFINYEMAVSQIPSILEYHEEYLVTTKLVPLKSNVSKYQIPDRAIGMKLRDLYWQDAYGNLFQMSQITEEDKAFFQRSIGANQAIHKYYMEGNDVCLSPTPNADATGFLSFVFFLRPNQLVRDSRAAIITNFSKNVTINNSNIANDDELAINDTVFVAGVDFSIGASSAETATNLAAAIASSGIASAGIVDPVSGANVITVSYSDLSTKFTTNKPTGLVINSLQGIKFGSIPSHITEGVYIDFLQTKPGHKIRNYDVLIPANGIKTNIISFTASDVPADLVVGDYICASNEAIIPQIPPDLHNGLAERAAARILASMGDVQGLQIANAKIEEINRSQGTLLDNRVDGSPRKITNKHSLLRWGRLGTRRRF